MLTPGVAVTLALCAIEPPTPGLAFVAWKTAEPEQSDTISRFPAVICPVGVTFRADVALAISAVSDQPVPTARRTVSTSPGLAGAAVRLVSVESSAGTQADPLWRDAQTP